MISGMLATKYHERELQALASMSMPGRIRISFKREPDFFQGTNIHGNVVQIITVVRDDSCVLGMACRSLRQMYVNGSVQSIGYLSGLRTLNSQSSGKVLATGFELLRSLHADKSTPAYLFTITKDNFKAQSLLLKNRSALPKAFSFGRYITYAINVLREQKRQTHTIAFHRGDVQRLDEMLTFINKQGSRKQFFPYVTQSHFGSSMLHGLNPSDFIIGYAGNRIVGIMGLWDQNSFKKIEITGYATWLSLLRPLANPVLVMSGYCPLPKAPVSLNCVYGCFISVLEDDPDIFHALLAEAYQICLIQKNKFIMIGLHERDPLNAALKGFTAFTYMSQIYVAAWPDGMGFVNKLDPTLVPYLELGSL